MSIEAYTAYRRASRRRSSRTPFNPLRSIENEVELTGDINAADSTDLEDVGVKIRTEAFTEVYTVEAELGRGKFATVKKCRCNITGEVVAAKIQRKRRKGVDARQELIHEIRMLAMCKIHPRIIGLKEVFESRHEIIIITEFASGGELYREMQEREEGFTESQVTGILRQTLEGLAFLHQRNIVHMDIKPQNLLLSASDINSDIFLCDLGFSRTVSNDKDVREIVGTPDFVAPEVLNYEPISTAVDMWSVGVLTYMLLSGFSPFAGADKMETFSNITQAKLDFPSDLFQLTSDQAKDFVSKLLIRNPRERLTVTECLDHPWMEECVETSADSPSLLSVSTSTETSDDCLSAVQKQDGQYSEEGGLQGPLEQSDGKTEHTMEHIDVKATDRGDQVDKSQSSENPLVKVCTDCELLDKDSSPVVTESCEEISPGINNTSSVAKDSNAVLNEKRAVVQDNRRPLDGVHMCEFSGVERRFIQSIAAECEVLPPLIEECEELAPLSKAQKDLCNARKVQYSPLSSPVGCRRALAPSPETVREVEPSKKHACRRPELTHMLKVQHSRVLDLELDTDTNAVVSKRGSPSVKRTTIKSLPHTKSLVTFYENLLQHS